VRAACRSNIALFHSGMSSSVCDTCRWGTEEAVAPGGLFSLDVNAPISAPIKGREPCPAAADDDPSRELDWLS
jgi:hypothetical protein